MLKHIGLALSLAIVGASGAQADAFRLDAAQMDVVSAGSSLAGVSAESLALASRSNVGTFSTVAAATTAEPDAATSEGYAEAVTGAGYTLTRVDGLVVTDGSGLIAGGGAEAISPESPATSKTHLWLKSKSNKAVVVTIGRVRAVAGADDFRDTFTYAEPIGDPMVFVNRGTRTQNKRFSRSFRISVSIDRK
jgi:hypothetical protein